MPQDNSEEFVVGGDHAGGVVRASYVHGLLLPIKALFYKWADKDENKNKIEGTGGQVTHAEWVKLPDRRRYERWVFEVDPRVVNPALERTFKRTVTLVNLFPEWPGVVGPSIMETVGIGSDSVREFASRAKAGTWYVEAELVHTGTYVNDAGETKPQNTFKFTRMTQNLGELTAWNAERYPKRVDKIPDDLLATARKVFAKYKGDTDKFNTIVSDDDELNPYLIQFSANDYALVRA